MQVLIAFQIIRLYITLRHLLDDTKRRQCFRVKLILCIPNLFWHVRENYSKKYNNYWENVCIGAKFYFQLTSFVSRRKFWIKYFMINAKYMNDILSNQIDLIRTRKAIYRIHVVLTLQNGCMFAIRNFSPLSYPVVNSFFFFNLRINVQYLRGIYKW